MQESFFVLLGEEKIEVDRRIAEVSQYLHNILSLGLDEEEIEIDPNIVSRRMFDKFVEFCRMNEYKEPDVARPIRTNNLSEVIDSKNFNFIKEFPIDDKNNAEIFELLNAANFFVCRGLQTLIASVFACKIYFQDSKKDYEEKKKELGIDKEITFEDEEVYKANYFCEESK